MMRPKTCFVSAAVLASTWSTMGIAQVGPGARPQARQVGSMDPSLKAQVFDVTLPSGIDQRLLSLVPPHARGTLIMLPGGSGDVGIDLDGSLRHPDNFVVRTRAMWAARGYAVLIPDTVNGGSLRGVRSRPEYADVVGAIVAFARRHGTGPVFLFGTSQGSIAAVNGAAHAAPGTIAGLVLTESVSRVGGSHETVFDADPAGVSVPTLVVANRRDRCGVAPPEDAARIAAALRRSPEVRVLAVSGGVERTPKACGSLTPHGYDGIEPEVVDAVVRWLDRRM